MKTLPRTLLLPVGVVLGSSLTVAVVVGQSSPVAFQACVGADRVLRLAESGNCARGETSVPLGGLGSAPSQLPGAPAPDRLDTVTSPNGQFVVDVQDDRITLSGGGASLELTGGGIQIRTANDIAISSAADFTLAAGQNTTLTTSSALRLTATTDVAVTSGANFSLAAGQNATLTANGNMSLDAAKVAIAP